jgi:SAM-dependent methyltransferase
VKLNLGCGNNKIEGCINIDVEESCKPDIVHDFTKAPLPYETSTVDEIYFFHTIEHIRKPAHGFILQEIYRTLKIDGRVFISYPNFEVTSTYFLDNHQGKRDFWEATLFGRQLYPSDYHVCAIIPSYLELMLGELGFEKCLTKPEKGQEFNSVTTAVKGTVKQVVGYESEVRRISALEKYKLITV